MEILLLVTQELSRRGYVASYEYPGFVSVSLPNGSFVHFGDVNPVFGGDYFATARDVERGIPSPDFTVSTTVPTTCTDVAVIASAFEDGLANMRADIDARGLRYVVHAYAPSLQRLGAVFTAHDTSSLLGGLAGCLMCDHVAIRVSDASGARLAQ